MLRRWLVLHATACSLVVASFHPLPALSQESPCADVDGSGDITATDALGTLRAAIAVNTCEPCRCDIDGDSQVRTRDALAVLRAAVGQAVDLECPACDAGTCGDGELAPYAGGFFKGIAILAICEELDSGGPGSPPPYTSELTKAFDRNLERVDDSVTLTVENNGCFCHDLSRHGPASSTGQITVTSATSATSLDCSDCFFTFTVETASEIAALEIETGFQVCNQEAQIPGMRTEIQDFSSPSVIRLDGGVAEECDDGNEDDDDRCTAECRVRSGDACHFDASSQECTGACGEETSCVIGRDGGCVCTAAVCGQCISTLDLGCSGACSVPADCPPNAICGGHPVLGECPNIECPCCPVCGDGKCTLDESRCNCASDCGPPRLTDCTSATCGDTFCEPSSTDESHENCPEECFLACQPCSD